MHTSVAMFIARTLSEEEVRGSSILDIGSRDVNGVGCLLDMIDTMDPGECIGIDIQDGPCVDRVLDASDVVSEFGECTFDVVLVAEVLEHVKNWEEVVSNIKQVCESGGTIIITTRSKGFRYHGFPNDFWRYELEDMEEIFEDFHIQELENDSESAGVFMKARKPADFEEKTLTNYELYSVVRGRKTSESEVPNPRSPISRFRMQYREQGWKWLVVETIQLPCTIILEIAKYGYNRIA